MNPWQYFISQGVDLHVQGRIDEESAKRQRKTAKEILHRLTDQPGIILADEVGMGKTFVALAVACSVALQREGEVAVVVMVPPSLRDKWPKDFEVFRQHCLRADARDRLRAPAYSVGNGVDLLKLLDDPPERRNHVIFATHGALSRGLSDKWVKLALVRHALAEPELEATRRSFPRFAAQLLDRTFEPELVERLFDNPLGDWRAVLAEEGIALNDDPVPEALFEYGIDPEVLAGLHTALELIPRRGSKNLDARLDSARTQLKKAMNAGWHRWLRTSCQKVELPLLILDEAHHLKNPSTKLARLFVDGDADAQVMGGALGGVFQRMMFLTATPFQLGHHELMRVLERFQNITWSTAAPTGGRAACEETLTRLRDRLDDAQRRAQQLEQTWGRLRPDHLSAAGCEDDVEDWWWMLEQGSIPRDPDVIEVRTRFSEAGAAMRAAERELRPWVLRHLKPRTLPESSDPRRKALDGAQLVDASRNGGLKVTGDALLPFLLAARARAMVASSGGRNRAMFAEGLASSFEAFRHTRTGAHGRDEDADNDSGSPPGDVAWYLEQIDRILPRTEERIALPHPKLEATVERALKLWARGEKVLIFCFYRATGRALERHLSARLDTEINRLAAKRMGVNDPNEAGKHLKRLGDRLNDDGPLRREADAVLEQLIRKTGQVDAETEARIVDVMRRFSRTPAFLARFYPFDDAHEPFARALRNRDASGIRLDAKLDSFCRLLLDRATADERNRYLDALDRIQTGERYGRDDDDAERVKLLPNVRLANGETAPDTRQRLLLSFNTPFFPEIFIASAVMSEGVDLHLDCRHIIHHDLCWNPSTLEQRTGRVDRLGAKAETAGQSIHVYSPYVEQTQDEKMFRVVRDRERWFQVVMGDTYAMDEASTDALAERIPFPEAAARALALRLEVDPPTEPDGEG